MMKIILVMSALQRSVTGVTGARRHREGKMHSSRNFQGIDGDEEDFGTRAVIFEELEDDEDW